MDHAGIGRTDLYGVSEGGPMAILFAATYPDRVGRLILNSTAARLTAEATRDETTEAIQRDVWAQVMGVWGTSESFTLDLMAPSLAGDPEFRRWWQRYERQSATSKEVR